MNATTSTYLPADRYAAMSAVELRKAAQGKIPNAKKHRKAELIDLLVEWDAKSERISQAAADDFAEQEAKKAAESASKTTKAKTQARVQAKPAPVATDHESDAKTTRKQRREDGAENKAAFQKAVAENKSTKTKKTGQKMCQVCGKRAAASKRVNDGIEGMCEPCYEYAGWENTHSDDAHEQGKEEGREFPDCPVCQDQDPANDDVKTKANGSKVGRTVSKPVKTENGQSKAARFAADAKELGWKVRTENDGKGLEIVTAHAAGGEWIRIQWQDNRCLNTGTTHKRQDGKTVHLRNASAARKALEA